MLSSTTLIGSVLTCPIEKTQQFAQDIKAQCDAVIQSTFKIVEESDAFFEVMEKQVDYYDFIDEFDDIANTVEKNLIDDEKCIKKFIETIDLSQFVQGDTKKDIIDAIRMIGSYVAKTISHLKIITENNPAFREQIKNRLESQTTLKNIDDIAALIEAIEHIIKDIEYIVEKQNKNNFCFIELNKLDQLHETQPEKLQLFSILLATYPTSNLVANTNYRINNQNIILSHDVFTNSSAPSVHYIMDKCNDNHLYVIGCVNRNNQKFTLDYCERTPYLDPLIPNNNNELLFSVLNKNHEKTGVFYGAFNSDKDTVIIAQPIMALPGKNSPNNFYIRCDELGKGSYVTTYNAKKINNPSKKRREPVQLISSKNYVIKIDKNKKEMVDKMYSISSLVPYLKTHAARTFRNGQAYVERRVGKEELFTYVAANRKVFCNESDTKFRLKLILNLLLKVKEIHSLGIMHLDLKLENLTYNEKGDIYIIDFGGSEFYKNNIQLHPQGTLENMAPETLEGKYGSPETDLFSIGIAIGLLLNADQRIVEEDLQDKAIKMCGDYLKKKGCVDKDHPYQQLIDLAKNYYKGDFSKVGSRMTLTEDQRVVLKDVIVNLCHENYQERNLEKAIETVEKVSLELESPAKTKKRTFSSLNNNLSLFGKSEDSSTSQDMKRQRFSL